MAEDNRRRNVLIAVLVVVVLLLLFLGRCMLREEPMPEQDASTSRPAGQSAAERGPATRGEAKDTVEELSAATLTGPERTGAGATFEVTWKGPDNAGDFVTVVKPESAQSAAGNYRLTQEGARLKLTAPLDPGLYEVRYVTGRSKSVLGRMKIQIEAVSATLEAAEEVTLGSRFEVKWTGPNNEGDYVTIVESGAADDQYGSYVNSEKGSPVTLTAPPVPGGYEVRYVSGQGRTVLARRKIAVADAQVTLSAPAEVVAGSTVEVSWTGPNNAGDYVTVVTEGQPDGQYGNYELTSGGPKLKLLMPIMDGRAELRYMTGQGGRVLARREIRIHAAKVTLAAAAEAKAGEEVSVTWTGPNNAGDYITIVSKGTPDGQYAAYVNTTAGSPLKVTAPKDAGEAEVRYMTGQGNKVLARRLIRIVK